jgi:hypothetical protein
MSCHTGPSWAKISTRSYSKTKLKPKRLGHDLSGRVVTGRGPKFNPHHCTEESGPHSSMEGKHGYCCVSKVSYSVVTGMSPISSTVCHR